jgi:hypothetical protein
MKNPLNPTKIDLDYFPSGLMAAPGWESRVVAHHGLFHGLGLSHDHAPWRKATTVVTP